jgi:septation ring formation regulator EzrA
MSILGIIKTPGDVSYLEEKLDTIKRDLTSLSKGDNHAARSAIQSHIRGLEQYMSRTDRSVSHNSQFQAALGEVGRRLQNLKNELNAKPFNFEVTNQALRNTEHAAKELATVARREGIALPKI